MKAVFDVDHHGNVTLNGMAVGVIPVAEIPNLEKPESKQVNVVELVSAGMDADDIIKLKHGGVI